jgi:tetratricopeptide (TPR) repeat protein
LLDALTSYRDSLAIAERLAKADPGDAQRQRDLSLSYDNVGDVLEAQGNLPDALTSYRDSLAIAERLANDDPGDAQRQRDLSLSYDNVGDVLEAQGNSPDALKAYRDGLGIRERLAGVDPSNAAWQIDVLRAQWRLAAHGDDAAQRWAFVVSMLRRLKSENKLTTEQASLLAKAEEELSKIARP